MTDRAAGLSEIFVGGFETATCGVGKRVEILAQILRERRAGLGPLASPGMRKSQLCCMKKLPVSGWQFGVADKKFGRGAIKRVSDKGMLHRGEMYTDLMRSAGVELDFQQRRRA